MQLYESHFWLRMQYFSCGDVFPKVGTISSPGQWTMVSYTGDLILEPSLETGDIDLLNLWRMQEIRDDNIESRNAAHLAGISCCMLGSRARLVRSAPLTAGCNLAATQRLSVRR